MSAAEPPLLCIMGPTAAGKTALAIELAERLNGELISVDSALVYRGLDIGAAKPDYPHHLIDICDPAEAYSAARFAVDAANAVRDVRSRGRRPILVGGTMLYFRALLHGLAEMPEADPEMRRRIEAEAAERGWPALHAELADVDPEAAARIHPNHSQRLSRALEVYRLTGVPLTRYHESGEQPAIDEPVLAVALAPRERSVLHARIAQRFELMLEEGFLEEVAGLRERGDLHADLPAIRAVGYRQLWSHLAGECTLDEAVERAVIATRQLAKRQYTWLRKWPELHWLLSDEDGRVVEYSAPGGTVVTAPTANPSDLVLNYLT